MAKHNHAPPVRTCVGCRRRAPQASLVRFVRDGERWSPDLVRRAAGRGAYLCSEPCARRAAKNKRYPGLGTAADSLDWRALHLCASDAAVYDGAVPERPERPKPQ